MPVVCNICEKTFSSQSVHNRHVREVHKTAPESVSFSKTTVWSYRCMEDNCDNAFRTNKGLMEHLEKSHVMKFEAENYTMENLIEFNKWKSEIETLNSCSYVLKSKYSSTNGEIIYYNCNRSNTSYNPNNDDHRRRLQKSQGVCKLSHSCTSQIKVQNENKKIFVEWQKTHYGHTFDLQHLRLQKSDKQLIASKLISGVTPRRLLESTRDQIGDELKRIDLLTSKDIRNIKGSYGVESRDGKRNPNDAFSVDLWVQECKKSPENPLLLYKYQGEEHNLLQKTDFCIIIMNHFQRQMLKKFPDIITVDGTHGLNGYDFEMTTVMVIDEYGHGFPVATMFSNRKDTLVQDLFFTSIREAVGIIHCKIFMSDMAEMFFNAWKAVMGEGCRHLFCAWHIDRAWQANLNKIWDKEKRAEIYKIIKTLQQQTSEINFAQALDNAIRYMCSDKESKSFGEYFKNTYSRNFAKWAYCFRKDYNINTNMHLESMHKSIKYFYLERKTVKRLDKGLNAVLQYIRDKTVERVIRLTKGENTKLTKVFTEGHKHAIERRDNYIITKHVMPESDRQYWKIKKNDNIEYCIQKVLERKCCEQICKICRICNHMYVCDCEYYKNRKRICKHIHILFNKLNSVEFKNFEYPVDNNSIVEALSTLSNGCYKSCDKGPLIEKKIKDLITKLENTSYGELDDAIIAQIHQHLVVIDNLTNCPKFKVNNEFPVKNHTSKRVINPQIRFVSTKRKRIETSTALKTGTVQQIRSIQENLAHDMEESFIVKSQCPSYDHEYC